MCSLYLSITGLPGILSMGCRAAASSMSGPYNHHDLEGTIWAMRAHMA